MKKWKKNRSNKNRAARHSESRPARPFVMPTIRRLPIVIEQAITLSDYARAKVQQGER